jgi:hypothetical protein
MDFDRATIMAEENLIEGATLDELKEVVRDLRALSSDSVLADLVEAKIQQMADCSAVNADRSDDRSRRDDLGGCAL